ncbi:MAG: cohesin domain-containing protein [Candidatus Paceibacterota bacterium]|jgi:hypothetical protein
MEKKYLKFIFLSLWFVCAPDFSFAATLGVSPASGTYEVGERFTVRAMATSESQFNAVALTLLFPPSIFSLDSISKSGSLLTFWVMEPVISESEGTLSLEGVTPGGINVLTGPIISATLHGTHAGTGSVSFQSGKILANDGLGTDIMNGTTGAHFTIVEPEPEPEPEIPPVIPPGTDVISPPTITPPIAIPETPVPSIGTSTLPIISAPLELSFQSFDFFEAGEWGKMITPVGDVVSADSNKNLRVSILDKKLPAGTVSIDLKIKNFKKGDAESVFGFLALNKEARRETTIDLGGVDGQYSVIIDVFDRDNKRLARVFGTFNLEPKRAPLVARLSPELTKQITVVTENISPSAVPIGIAVGASQTIVLVGNIGSFYDLYLFLLKFISLILGFFRRKKAQPWGVVYDSVTKQPIDPAYVVMEDAEGKKKKKTAITDLDGRYGFLVEPGSYYIVANKTHYKFPSELLADKEKDEMYDNLYFGSPIETKEDKVIRYNIPLDPIEFDWNEFTKNKEHIFNLYSRKEKIRAFVFNALFFFGFSVSAMTIVFAPTAFNFAFFGFYAVIIVFQVLWKRKHKITRLFAKDGKPLSFAIVTAKISGLAIPVVKKVTADIMGRFYLLTQPGTYDISVMEKQPDASYKEVYAKPAVTLKKGVISQDIIVE